MRIVLNTYLAVIDPRYQITLQASSTCQQTAQLTICRQSKEFAYLGLAFEPGKYMKKPVPNIQADAPCKSNLV
jgi:hypothetical protein